MRQLGPFFSVSFSILGFVLTEEYSHITRHIKPIPLHSQDSRKHLFTSVHSREGCKVSNENSTFEHTHTQYKKSTLYAQNMLWLKR